jgi:hypothetical protein
MNRGGYQFFECSRLAYEQYGQIDIRDTVYLLHHFNERLAAPNQIDV